MLAAKHTQVKNYRVQMDTLKYSHGVSFKATRYLDDLE